MKVEDFKENYQIGYIRLFRSLKNKGWYKKSDYVHLWIHILIKATHKGIEYFFNGENIYLSPGQFITGRKILSEETGINESKVERILTFFEKSEQQIEQQKSNKSRLISIVNWQDYQQSEQQNEQQLNNKRTTTEQQLNTYNNVKNDNKYIYNEFYDEQLKLSEEDEKYKMFIEILFGKNLLGRKLNAVLSMKEQVSWNQMKSVDKIKNDSKKLISELLVDMENWLMKNPKSKNSTVVGTLRTFSKPKQ